MWEHKFILTLSKAEHNQESKPAIKIYPPMRARNILKYFWNYVVFTNVYAIDPGVYNYKLTHQKCSNTILPEIEFI